MDALKMDFRTNYGQGLCEVQKTNAQINSAATSLPEKWCCCECDHFIFDLDQNWLALYMYG